LKQAFTLQQLGDDKVQNQYFRRALVHWETLKLKQLI